MRYWAQLCWVFVKQLCWPHGFCCSHSTWLCQVNACFSLLKMSYFPSHHAPSTWPWMLSCMPMWTRRKKHVCTQTRRHLLTRSRITLKTKGFYCVHIGCNKEAQGPFQVQGFNRGQKGGVRNNPCQAPRCCLCSSLSHKLP